MNKKDPKVQERLRELSSNPMLLKFCSHYRFDIRATIIEQCAMNPGIVTQSVNKSITDTPKEYQMYELAQFFHELSVHAEMVFQDIELRLIAGEYGTVDEHKRSKKIVCDVVQSPNDLIDLASFEASLQRCKYMCLEPDIGVFNSLINGLLFYKANWNKGKHIEISKSTHATKYQPIVDDWLKEKAERRRNKKAKAMVGASAESFAKAIQAKPRNRREPT